MLGHLCDDFIIYRCHTLPGVADRFIKDLQEVQFVKCPIYMRTHLLLPSYHHSVSSFFNLERNPLDRFKVFDFNHFNRCLFSSSWPLLLPALTILTILVRQVTAIIRLDPSGAEKSDSAVLSVSLQCILRFNSFATIIF